MADFGLARVLRETEATDLTQIGMTMGTPLYMSPEQVEGRPLDPRSDLYSFGVTCYHMLTGKPPFVGETALAVAVQHLKKQPRPLEEQRARSAARLVPHRAQAAGQGPGPPLAVAPRVPPRAVSHSPGVPARTLPRRSWGNGTPWRWVRRPTPGSAPRGSWPTAMRSTAGRPGRRRWMLAAAGGRGLPGRRPGGLAATRPPPLLPNRRTAGRRVPKQIDRLATVLSMPARSAPIEAWQSVIEYLPEKQDAVFPCQATIPRFPCEAAVGPDLSARAELRRGRWRSAGAGRGDGARFRVQGVWHGREGGVLSLMGRNRESADVLEALWQFRQELKDVQMRRMLTYVTKENRAKFGAQSTAQWDSWLSEQFHPEG